MSPRRRTADQKTVWRQCETRSRAAAVAAAAAGSVGLSVALIAVPEHGKQKSSPLSPPGAIAIFENGLELRGRTPLAEKPCRSFSSGQRRQLYEHESPGETALLTSYLLGSSEGGTNSPFNLTNEPPTPSPCHPCGVVFFFALRFGDKICGYSLFLELSAGVDNVRFSCGSFPREEEEGQGIY